MKKLGVRERIIETASELFYNQGYNQTGINQIIDEANVAKASLYQHFKSKEDIAVAYLIARHSSWMRRLNDTVSFASEPKEKVLACFDFLMIWLKEVNFRGCGWQNIITDLPTDQAKIRDQAIYHKNELRSWIHSQLLSTNSYSEEEAEDIGDQIIILIEGAIILSQIQKAEWPIAAAKKAGIKLLVK